MAAAKQSSEPSSEAREPQGALQRATAASNEWRSHAFRELAPFQVPSGDVLTAGDLAAAYRVVDVPADREYAIWGPSRLNILAVRGADESGEDPDTPHLGDLESLIDAWLERVEADAVASVELPHAIRGGARLLATRGFQPVSAFAVRRIGDADLESDCRHGVKLRRPEPDDREGLIALLRELHLADWEAGGAAMLNSLDAHLGTYVDRILADPSRVWVAHYFGMLTGFANFAPDEHRHLTSYEHDRYLQFAVVTRRMRGGGIGRALVDAMHRDAVAAGVEAISVNYAAMNPEAGPFWHRRGYRPLSTIWRRLS